MEEQKSQIGENAPKKISKEKSLANLKPPWKEGQSGNPKGRPKGSKNFDTLFEEAIKKIAKEKKLVVDDPEIEMVVNAVSQALKGNYSFFRDLMDRMYGRPKETIKMGLEDKLEGIEVKIIRNKEDVAKN